MFWGRNTFYFDGLCECGRGLGVGRTLKVMGQTASRMIERITIRMPTLGNESTALRKVLSTLSSRARLGHFQKLELVWEEPQLAELMLLLESGMGHLYYQMMIDLREGFEGERFERVVKVPARAPTFVRDEDDRYWYGEVVRGLHGAVGGRMFCGICSVYGCENIRDFGRKS